MSIHSLIRFEGFTLLGALAFASALVAQDGGGGLVKSKIDIDPQFREKHVYTQHNDNHRTGAYLYETVLSTSNVNSKQFGKLFERPVDGFISAQPLYMSMSKQNIVYVATMHNSVYAFDADHAAASKPVWHTNLGKSFKCPPKSSPLFYKYSNFQVEIGIVSTPVIDPLSSTLYVVAFIDTGKTQEHRLFALDLQTGKPKPGHEKGQLIDATVAGTGAGSVGGKIHFHSPDQNQRAALLLANKMIYLAFASYADQDKYHGWLMAYDAGTLKQHAVYCTTPQGIQGGIWQSGQGPAADAHGNVYVMVGNNGASIVPKAGADMGNAVLKFSSTLKLLDWFVPKDYANLNKWDADLGVCGPLLLPDAPRLIAGGKMGRFVVLDIGGANTMGHFDPKKNHVLQDFRATRELYPPGNPNHALDQGRHIHGSPIYWDGPQGARVYVWGEADWLRAYAIDHKTGIMKTTPVSMSTMMCNPGMPGAMLSLSANGKKQGTGIVWASHSFKDDAVVQTTSGILRAFDATDLGKELWNSKMKAGDDSAKFPKFTYLTIINGKVYAATFSNKLLVYGLHN